MVDGRTLMWESGELLHEGAEATVTEGFWLGRKAVLKSRRPRAYRHPDLDRRLTKQRLSVEARVLSKLSRSGFPCPSLIYLDQQNSQILMTRVDGRPLYHLLKEGETSSKVLRNLGSLIRRLHIQGVSHGDLTTHNVMITDDGTLFLIDFGLSRQSPELEHMGLDLQVLNECLGASHSTIIDGIEAVCEGYLNEEGLNNSESAETVIDRFNKITGRVRYHG